MSPSVLRDMLLGARMQLRISRAIYQGPNALQELAREVGANYRWISVGNVAAGALIFESHIHLSVAGTNDRQDWIQNFNAHQTEVAGFEVHQGFAQASDWLLTEIRRAGIVSMLDTRELVLGGHSSGGAVAQVLSLDDRLSPREMFTFGSPRVFSLASAPVYAAYPWETQRFVMPGDPVPRLPLRTFRTLFGRASYSHTTSAMEIHDDGSIVFQEEVSLLKRLAIFTRQAWTYWQAAGSLLIGKCPAIADAHSVNRYYMAVEAALVKFQSQSK